MKPKVLFLCTGNSARSQMAEGYLRSVADGRFDVMSAGIEPKGLNPLAVAAMREIGIDIAGQRSKDVTEFLGTSVQYVVTVCSNAREKCPVFPATVKFVHWDLDDPAAVQGTEEEKLAAFRQTRNKIAAHIDSEFRLVEGRKA
ncbi:MAG TPA: arsenate reductase ArsC [Candidatus Dormibacteraeota bacterium]|nr:arsenate reductase ArsC [Candidatus Dormibacteraeota bacterium]